MGLSFDLGGRTALVTGAAAGIGRAISDVLAECGAHIVALDHNAEAAERTVRELQQRGHQALAAHVDVADTQAVASALSDILGKVGAIDILVLCAAAEGSPRRFSMADPTMPIDGSANRRLRSVEITPTRSSVSGLRNNTMAGRTPVITAWRYPRLLP